MKANNLPDITYEDMQHVIDCTAFHAIMRLIDREGGDQTTDRKSDRGGLTRWGIAQKYWPQYDVLNMTMHDVVVFYYREFWLPSKAGELPIILTESIFDMAVNQGLKPAICCLQKSVGANPDGVFGAKTRAAVRHCQPFKAFFKFQQFRHQRYVVLCRTDPTQLTNLNGWLNRMNEVQQVSLIPRLMSGSWTH